MKPAPPVMRTLSMPDTVNLQDQSAAPGGRLGGSLGRLALAAMRRMLLLQHGIEEHDGALQPFAERHTWLPAQLPPRELDIRAALGGIIMGQRQEDGARARPGNLDNQ